MSSLHRNYALDLLKIAAFFGIVGLHAVSPVGGVSSGLNICARIGVPVFFAVSGYFAAQVSVSVIGRRAKRIGILIAGALAFHLVVSLLGFWGEFGSRFVGEIIAPTSITDLFYFNSVPVAYHLWFLFALLFVYAAFAVYRAASESNRAWCLMALLLFAFRFCFSEVRADIDPLGAECRTWLLMGVPSFALGVAVRSGEQTASRLSGTLLFVLVLLGFALSFVEYKLFGLQELYCGTMLSVFGLLCLCLKYPRMGRWGEGDRGRICSRLVKVAGGEALMVAYVVHLVVLYWVELVLGPIQVFSLYPYLLMTMTFCISVLFGMLYEKARMRLKSARE